MVPSGIERADAEALARARRVRAALMAAFGGLLALMVIAGLDSLRSLRQLNDLEREVSQRFAAHSQALSSIVLSVHVYNEQMESYLIPGGTAERAPTAAEVAAKGGEVLRALQTYPADRDREEQLLLNQIQTKLVEQSTSFATVAVWRAQERTQRGPAYLRQELMPRRGYILTASREIAELNNRRLGEANEMLSASFLGLQTRVARMVVMSLGAGLLLSLVGALYILRLERQGRERYTALVASRAEMESLSARLLDAQEEERRAISRELHDEVGQSLGALLVDLGQVAKLVPPDDAVVQGQIARIKSTAETAVKSIRDMALLLRPPMLDDLGLVAALEWQAREVSRRGTLEAEVEAEDVDEDLPNDVKVCVYRVAQEALNNAASHADAKNAKVSVAEKGGKIVVEVRDDGRGFDPARTRGMGMLGMEERVRRLGGTFRVSSAPAKGTTVHAEIPLRHEEKAAQ